MAYDVFLSYARTDADQALVIKEALESLGLTVFFDIHGLDGGDVFPEVLQREIIAAGATLGIWNTNALSRDWVRREAEIARENKTLVPVEIGPISDSVMTVALSKLHRIKLGDFDGAADHADWQNVVRAVAKMLRRPDLVKTHKEQAKEVARTEKLEAELEKQRARNAKILNARFRLRWPHFAGFAVVALAAIIASSLIAQNNARNRILLEAIPTDTRSIINDIGLGSYARSSDDPQDLLGDLSVANLVMASAVGDSESAVLAGWAYVHGLNGVEADFVEANRLFQLACDSGQAFGCVNYAANLFWGNGAEQDREKALKLFARSCELGSAWGCNHYGYYSVELDRSAETAIQAATFYEKGCALGNGRACINRADQLLDSELGEDAAQHDLFLQAACDHEWHHGCSRLAYRLYRNYEKDEAKLLLAQSLYERGCFELRGDRSCRELIDFSLDRDDGVFDATLAMQAAQTNCQDGRAGTCIVLGWLHLGSEHFPRDLDAGRHAYEYGCSQEHSDTCIRWATALISGKHLPQDIDLGVYLLRSQCDEENREGCAYLRDLYADKADQPYDLDTAIRFAERTCEIGRYWDCETLADLLTTRNAGEADLFRARDALDKYCNDEARQTCYERSELILSNPDVFGGEEQELEKLNLECDTSGGEACFMVATIHSIAPEIEYDADLSAKFFEKICSGSDLSNLAETEADGTSMEAFRSGYRTRRFCRRVGLFYADDQAIQYDPERARHYLRATCGADDAESCERLSALESAEVQTLP